MSINSFKFVCDKAVLKKKRERTKMDTVIPQPDGTRVPIPVINPSDSRKTLGVLTNTKSTSHDHLRSIKKKGLAWGARLRAAKYLKPRDGWLTFQIQPKSQLEWGLVCLNESPTKVEMLGGVYIFFLVPSASIGISPENIETCPRHSKGWECLI